MKEFHLTIGEYYGAPLGAGVPFPRFMEFLNSCKPTIGELVARYDIVDRDLLSLGAGPAFEEYWFAQADCRLTLIDIHEEVEAHVSALPKVIEGDSRPLTYVIEDAGRYVEARPQAEFDVLYVSSFHPDEIRRERIQEAFCTTRSPEQAQNYVSWPAGTEPYHEMIVRAFRKVREGGLIILQHYRGGPYVTHNAHYIDDIASQFRCHGAALLEVHCFRKSPAHLLVTACKGADDIAAGIMRELGHRPPITMFHGRYDYAEIKTDVVKVFELGNPAVSAEFLRYAALS
jgi:hypothetical protein